MLWIAPTERDADTETLEKRLWDAADQLRANSGLTSAQCSQPILGLIFLRFAEVRFVGERAAQEKPASRGRRSSRVDDPNAYQAKGALYLTPNVRFDHLLRLPEGGDVGKAVNAAMRDIEKHNPQLAGVLRASPLDNQRRRDRVPLPQSLRRSSVPPTLRRQVTRRERDGFWRPSRSCCFPGRGYRRPRRPAL